MEAKVSPFDRIPKGIAFGGRAISEKDGKKSERSYELNRTTSNGKQISATARGVKEADKDAVSGNILDARSAAIRFLEGADKYAALDLVEFKGDAIKFGLTNLSLDEEDMEILARLDEVEQQIKEAISSSDIDF